MHQKPLRDMSEDEVRAMAAALDHRIHELGNLFGEFRAISTQRQRVRAELRDRFGIDPRTGRRIRRKGRAGEFSLTG